MEKLNEIGCRPLAELINEKTESILFRMKRKRNVEWGKENEDAGSPTEIIMLLDYYQNF